MCIFKVIILLNIVVISIAEPGVSTIPIRGRSQSMSAATRNIEIKPVQSIRRTSAQSPPPPSSPSSSISSIKSLKNEETNSHAHASTSGFREVDLQREPLVDKSKHNSFGSSVVSLREASIQTHGERLIPSRDGVRARVHRILFQNAAPVAVGVSVGAAAGIAALEYFNMTRIIPKTTTTTSTTTQDPNDVNGIMNSIEHN